MTGEGTRIVAATDIRWKKNTTGVTIVKNTVVKLDATEDLIVLPTATTDHLYGVTMEDIPTGAKGGDVQVRGRACCRADGVLAVPGILLMSDAAGRVTTWAAAGGTNAQVVGQLEDTAGALDDVIMVELAGPGVIKQG